MKTMTLPHALVITLALLAALFTSPPALAAAPDGLDRLAEQAVALAGQRLGPLDDAARVACLTNAGYARRHDQNTMGLYDALARHAAISPGRGNLLVRPCPPGRPLYLMFLKKDGPAKLMMTYVTERDGVLTASQAMNIHLGKGASFKPFGPVLGDMAFNLVGLANGWAMGLPPDLMRGALKHGHLCCGVFTGYFTARYILEHMPLGPGQRYIYIGAPAWCQDDYLIDYLGVTPGTHGYVTMAYPWSRPWQTAGQTYANLGGVVVRWDPKSKTGQAWVLAFDWHNDEFRQYMGQPDLKLDWPGQPWLHNAYDRFFMTKLDQPDHFVSVVKTAPVKGQAQLDALTGLGANPLQALLGPDPSWPEKQAKRP